MFGNGASEWARCSLFFASCLSQVGVGQVPGALFFCFGSEPGRSWPGAVFFALFLVQVRGVPADGEKRADFIRRWLFLLYFD